MPNALYIIILLLPILPMSRWSVAIAAEPNDVAGAPPGGEIRASVSGTVSVAGNNRRLRPLPVFKNRVFCGATVDNETLIIGADGALKNAVILLRPVEGRFLTQPKAIILDNQHCAFTPHVQVATLGSDLLLKNSDPILHTVHARLGKDTLFNVGLPQWRRVHKRLDRVGVVRIDCDVLHTWMSAAIVVADTPYFALTDEAGRFKIDGLPTGVYDMEIWHERLGTKSTKLAIAGGVLQSVAIVYAQK